MNPEKILVIQLRRVGDVIFTLPIPGVLRRNFPDAKIDFLVEKPSDQLVRLNPSLNETLVYQADSPFFWLKKIRENRYDWVIDFHGIGRTLYLTLFSGARVKAGFAGKSNRKLVYNRLFQSSDRKYIVEQKLDVLRGLGLKADSWSWDLAIPEPERQWAGTFLAALTPGRKLVGIAPASRRETRRWKYDRFGELVSRLAEGANDLLLLWGPGEKEVVEAVLSSAKLERRDGYYQGKQGKVFVPPEVSLVRLAALIQNCDLVVAVDNGPKNIAVALKVPTLCLTGPTNPLSFNPHGDPGHGVLRDEKLGCIGCGLNRCPYQHECMENLTVEQVLETIHPRKAVTTT